MNGGQPAAGRRRPFFRAEFSLPAAAFDEPVRRAWSSPSVLWLLFSLFVVYAATIPFRYVGDLALVQAKLSALPLNPLISPDTGRRVSIPDVVQNVLLFLPFGVLGMLSSPGGSRRRRILIVTMLGGALSAFVEILQLFTADRVTAVSDLVADSAGTLLGAALFAMQERAFGGLVKRFAAAQFERKALAYPLIVFVGVVCLAEWHPFDVTLDVSSVWTHVKGFRAHPWDAGPLTDEVLECLRFAAAGAAIALWLRSCQASRPATIAALAGAALACGLETSQFFIESRGPDLRDAAVHGFGAIAGAALVARWRARPVTATTLTYAVTVLGAAVQELSPFALASTPHPLQWVPFLSYYEYTTTLTISHVVELLLMFLPFGFVLSLSLARGRGWLLASAATAAAVIPLEIAQEFVSGRYADVSDVVVCIVGALAGVWLASTGWQRFVGAITA